MPNEIVRESSGYEKTGTRTTTAVAKRDYTTAQVTDYDGLNGNYAIFWKRISISDEQGWRYQQTQSAADETYHHGDALWVYNDSGIYTCSGTRTVEFMFTYSVMGLRTDLILATCTVHSQSPGLSNPLVDHTVEGERVYGVSLQCNEEFITYTYEIDKVKLTTPFSIGMYDGPQNIEDFNFDFGGNDIWTLSKRMAGIINIDDGAGSTPGYKEEFEVDIPQTVYSIGTTYK
jgi:hypothetical protein